MSAARPDPREDGVIGNRHAKRRRTDDEPIETDGPIEDQATASEKLERAGFDPGKLTEAKPVLDVGSDALVYDATPMTYFCYHGDLPMCRYLLVHGAAEDVTTSSGFWFPMYAAACRWHLDICQWLFEHGAATDICRENDSGFTPLGAASASGSGWNRKKTCQWFIMNGALTDCTSGSVDRDLVIQNLAPDLEEDDGTFDIRPQLLSWARDVVKVHGTYLNTFLMGTTPPPEFSGPSLLHLLSTKLGSYHVATMLLEGTPDDNYQRIWEGLVPNRSSPLRCFNGLPGILELVADFVGVMRGRDLRTVRELADVLATVDFDAD